MSDERVRRLAGVDPAAWHKAAPGARVMTREGFPGTVTEVQDGPYPQTETYIVTLDSGMGGGEYAANEITVLNQAAASGARTAADDYPELGTILLDRPDHPRAITGMQRTAGSVAPMPAFFTVDELRQAGAEAAAGLGVTAQELLIATYVEQEVESGAALTEDDARAIAERMASAFGVEPGPLVERAISMVHFYKTAAVPVDWQTIHAQFWCGKCGYDGVLEPTLTPTGSKVDICPQCGDVTPYEEITPEGWPVAARLRLVAAGRFAKSAEYNPAKGPSLDPDPDAHTEKCRTYGLWHARMAVDEELLSQGVSEGAWGDLDALARTWLYDGTVDIRSMCICDSPDFNLSMLVREGQATEGPEFTEAEDEGWTDGFNHGSRSAPFAPRKPDNPEYLAAYHVGFTSGKMTLVETADDQPVMAGAAPKQAGVLDWIADKADQRLPPEQRWRPGHESSFDWCRFRRNSRCYYPKHLNEQASAQMGYAVWVPEDRGYCPRISWPMQQDCPVGEPGPHAPGGYTDATVPWEAGGQRNGVPSPGRYYAHLSDVTAVTDPEFRFHVTARWADVRDKAKRIRGEGRVRIVSANGGRDVVAQVQGETNVYQTRVTKAPGREAVAQWECGCAWAAYSWGRTGRWKKYEGRMCSHALATLYEAESRGSFGREVTEDAREPRWMDPTIPVKQDGDWDRDKGRYAALDGHDDPDVPPAQQWAEDALGSGEDATTVLGMLVSFGVKDAPSMLALALSGAEFRAKVRGLVQTVRLLADGTIQLANGQPVPAGDVLYPDYDPARGLSLHHHAARTHPDEPFDEETSEGYAARIKHLTMPGTDKRYPYDKPEHDPSLWGEHLYLHSTGSQRHEAVFGVPGGATVDDVVAFLTNGAQARASYVTNVLRELAEQVGGKMPGLDNRFKSTTRMREKIAQELRENPTLTAAQVGIRFADALRFTVLLAPESYSESAERFLDDLARRGFTPRDSRSIKNYWLDDDPYDGINAVMLTPDGFPFEVQFHTDASLSVKKAIHPVYRRFRAPDASPEERKSLWDQMTNAANSVVHPPQPLLVGVPMRQYLGAVNTRYFISTHPIIDAPTGLFRLVETDSTVEFAYWDGSTWVPDPDLVRHLAFGSNEVEEVSPQNARTITGEHTASLDEFAFMVSASADDMGPCTHRGGCGKRGKWYYGGRFRCDEHKDDFPPHEASAESVAADALAAATEEGTSPALVVSELLEAAHSIGAETFDAYGWYAPTPAGQQIARERTGSDVPDVVASESYGPKTSALLTCGDCGQEFAADEIGERHGDKHPCPGKKVAPERLAKQALKKFTPAERKQIIDEGEDGVTASNITDLDLSGTHYEALEAALAAQDMDGII